MATSNKQRRRKPGAKAASSAKSEQPGDAESLLRRDHRNVEKLFREFERADDDSRKQALAREIFNELTLHARIEEELFYPACRDKGVEDDMLDEAQVEHDGVKLLVAELAGDVRGPFYDAKMTVLSEYVKHHVKEEEMRGSGIFAKARKAGVDMKALGDRLRERRQEIMEREGGRELQPSPPRALRSGSGMFNGNRQEMDMERMSGRDRDDRGRFMDDDDRGSRGRMSGRGRDDDYDRSGRDSGRGWFGDSEGHSRASREGWEDRGSSRSSSRSRYDEEDDGRGSRGGSRGGPERDDQGRFMSDDDRGSRGRMSGRGRDDDDDDRGGRSRGSSHGGWFGDSRGHSEAARRGWRERD